MNCVCTDDRLIREACQRSGCVVERIKAIERGANEIIPTTSERVDRMGQPDNDQELSHEVLRLRSGS